ncbi:MULTISPECIES: hypothetical protein [Pseudomonas]|uniref:COG4315 family predicted lipoprotein n=1 Tax=Pseudomonas TaxID=286 RepID=UPI00249B7807|nr:MULTISPECIES: hypothetical protein [Pseudomonas]
MTLKYALAATALAFSGITFAAPPAMEKGGMLVDAKGMTLYTYDKDTKDISKCSGPCAENWPPLMADADAKPDGQWTLAKREDGTLQWAYADKPLYTFAKDKPGEMNGDGKGGVWHMAKP